MQKVQINVVTTGTVQVSPPPMSVVTTQTALKNEQIPFLGPHPSQNVGAKSQKQPLS